MHIRVTSVLGKCYLGSNSEASQGLRYTVKADKVDSMFELQGYLYGTVY